MGGPATSPYAPQCAVFVQRSGSGFFLSDLSVLQATTIYETRNFLAAFVTVQFEHSQCYQCELCTK